MGITQSNPYVNELPENNEDFQLIWLDTPIKESSDTRIAKNMLRSLNANAQFYTDVDKCIQLIPYMREKDILLVVSGSFARVVLSRISHMSYVRGVFIFCEIHQLYTDLLDEYPLKVIDICTDRINLIKSISKTMKIIEEEDIYFHLYHSKQHLTRQLTNESKLFIKNQLWIYVMKTFPTDEQAKNEMLDHCKDYYQHYKRQLKKIELFRNCYIRNDAIQYYTPKSFIYKILNKALYTEDIHLLCKFRFFINDLYAQIEKEKVISDQSIILYRNQLISEEKFEILKENIGSFISINGFLLTSRDKRVFNKLSKLPSWLQNKIQIQITIKANPNVTFANIKQQQVLFSMGSVFRIDMCEYDQALSLGKLRLTTTDEGQAILQSYLDIKKDQKEIYSPLILFGRFLMGEMNQIDRAKEYFKMLLKTLPNEHPDISEIYNQIGATHYITESELTQALEMFEKALEIRKNIYSDNDIRIASSLNNIGSVYNNRGEYDRALEYYQHGLQIVDNNQAENNIIKANLLYNCGIREERLNHYETAISFFIKADQIYSFVMHTSNSTHINRALKIAQLSIHINDISTALQYYQRAFHCCETIWIPTDQTFKYLWIDIVRYYLNFDHQEEAIACLNRTLKLCEQNSLYMHETSKEYIWSMAQLCAEAINFELALDYYKIFYQLETKQANYFSSMELTIDSNETEDQICHENDDKYIEVLQFKLSTYEKLFPRNDLEHASFLAAIARSFSVCQLTDFACQCYLKAFHIYETTQILTDANTFRICFEDLVDIYIHNNDEKSMTNILERTLKKCKQFSDNCLTEIRCLQYIADKYKANDDMCNSLRYLAKAFTHAEMICSYDDVIWLLEQIIKYYIKDEKQKLVETFVQRAIKICEKDCVQLVKCHQAIGEIYEYDNFKDNALEHFQQLFIATQSKEILLDKLWIDFIICDRSMYYSFGPLGEAQTMHSLLQLCRKHVSPNHIKIAVLLWRIALSYERAKITKMALDIFPTAIDIFEKLLYHNNDTRAKTMLNYLVYKNEINQTPSNFLLWLNYPQMSPFRQVGCANNDQKWKCILHRLNLYKMVHIDNQWEFHLKIEILVLDSELCLILFNECLQICRNQIDSDDTSLIICCLELVSHWYFIRDQFLESLLYRQYQLEVEWKIFHKHPHVAFSLWFIGLIFQKMKEYHSALGYFNRAMNIFEHLYTKEHNDIQHLEKYISQTKQLINIENLSTVENTTTNQRIQYNRNQYNPQLLEVSFHID